MFSNPVVDGNGGIVTRQIKSPNYVSGAAGWSIKRDGSAEFNNATFRGTVIIDTATKSILVYDGAPALGNLIFALANQGGQDSFGNGWSQGITLPTESGSLASPGLAFKNAGVLNALSYIATISAVSGANPGLNLEAFNGALIRLMDDNSAGAGILLGNHAERYKPYSEQVGLAAQNIASSATATTLANFTAQEPAVNDFSAGGFNLLTGIWTCPADGKYEWTLSLQFTGWVAGSRLIVFASRNGTAASLAFMKHDNTAEAGGAGVTLSAMKRFHVNDTVALRVAQVTGVGQTIDAVASPELCYGSVKLLP